MAAKKERNAGEEEYWMGVKLREAEKYSEAEHSFQESIRLREKALGAKHIHTLKSKYQLALAVYYQKDYTKAEQLFQESVQQREAALGAEHVNTLQSKHQWALTLRQQENYHKAEQLFQELVQQREKSLGAKHVDTLESKHQLAFLLYCEHKYIKAERLAQQLSEQREKILGADHVNTLQSKCMLAHTLAGQNKYSEAEQLLGHLIKKQEEVLGTSHEATIESKALLRDMSSKRTSSASKIAITRKLNNFFGNKNQRQTAYTDAEVQQLSRFLGQLKPRWREVPRLYIVLRRIDCLDRLDSFLKLGFSDHYFPVTEESLPSCLQPKQRSQFMNAQHLVYTQSLDLENGENGQHCHFRRFQEHPFEIKEKLGEGGYAQVHRAISRNTSLVYALKRVVRPAGFDAKQSKSFKLFINEIKILKGLDHRHVVKYVGSYTDPKHIGLVMSPVADMDLSNYLALVNPNKYAELRTFFGCLARSLAFLHRRKIRHKDIKPFNILVKGGVVMFTDFGLAYDYKDAEGSTTAGTVNGRTMKYCAPEVADVEPRNSSSDIWSLGVVFLEMTAVLKGKTVQFIDNFLAQHGTGLECVRSNPDGAYALMKDLERTGSPTDNAALCWAQDMIMFKQMWRPNADSLTKSICSVNRQTGHDVFYGTCCANS